jgi:hypothetical protein
MDDRGGDRPRDGRDGREGRGGQGGPPETSWLDLEISKVLYGRADTLAKVAAEELIKDAIKARLRERIGPRLDAIGKLAADMLADDVEANLEIEARIGARRDARRALDQRIREVFWPWPREGGTPAAEGGSAPEPPAEVTGEGWDPRKI